MRSIIAAAVSALCVALAGCGGGEYADECTVVRAAWVAADPEDIALTRADEFAIGDEALLSVGVERAGAMGIDPARVQVSNYAFCN